jgi:hypothetical protein
VATDLANALEMSLSEFAWADEVVPGADALMLWWERLAHLQKEEALATAADAKFTIGEQIEEAKAKISELDEAAGIPSGQATPTEPRFDISRIVKYAPPELIGREQETVLLDRTLAQMKRGTKVRPRVLTFVALGGEGKTSLVAKWVDGLDQKDWPGCEAAFAWSFYSQGSREQVAVSSDLFLAKALEFFGDAEMAASAQGAFEKGQRLARLVGDRKSVLVLDGLEPLQFPPHSATPGKLKDQGIEALLSGLARHSAGLCVVTTRFEIADVKSWPETAPQHELLRLSKQAGVDLLRSIRGGRPAREPKALASGDAPDRDPSKPEASAYGSRIQGTQAEFEALVEDVDGHALTLQILGQYLVRAHRGDIRRRDRIDFAKAEARIPGGPGFHADHAFRAMAAYEAWLADDSEESRRELAVLRLLGLFDRLATADCVQALLRAPAIDGLTDPLAGLSDEDWEFTLTTLSGARLVSVNRAEATGELLSLDAHPLIREYFAMRLRSMGPRPVNEPSYFEEHGPGAHATSEVWRAAHRRLYEHLCETTKEGDQSTLEDLQPLYLAVAHGCQAGVIQEALEEVYVNRILRGRSVEGGYGYSIDKLGAIGADLGAVASFFACPWTELSPRLSAKNQAWLLNVAAVRLRALGRLTESLEPMRVSMVMGIDQENWNETAIYASNLSELELTLGEVSGALSDAERSVTYADRSGDAFQRYSKRTTHADALHQSGRRSEAESLFREAEQMQAERQPAYPLLYSLQGFRYCDLLLAPAEREAWGGSLESRVESPEQEAPSLDSGLSTLDFCEACRAVTDRATQALKLAEEKGDLLSIALDHLTLARAALYQTILSASDLFHSASPISNLNSEIAGAAPVPAGRADLGPAPASVRWEPARQEIEAAVSGLRRAGTMDHLPRGLLTRAWLRCLLSNLACQTAGENKAGRLAGRTGTPARPGSADGQECPSYVDSAQSDLDEAWEIASRGPMPLFLADIHLHRARLFGEPTAPAAGVPENVDQPAEPAAGAVGSLYPWKSPEHDLAEARRLIEKHGYGRRMEELEDAERALLSIR